VQPCILQVEDDEDGAFLIKELFRETGITNPIHVVTDGQMAIDYLAGAGRFANRDSYPLPALVLLDLKLPKRSGFEVLAWLRQQPGLKKIIVIVLTSSSLTADINRAYELGANCFLVKPVEYDETAVLVKSFRDFWLKVNQTPDLQA